MEPSRSSGVERQIHAPGVVGYVTECLGCEYSTVDSITAVANLLRDQGFEVGVPVGLRSTNNEVAWMNPSPVVAKIAQSFEASSRELQVATQLAGNGAPVIPPVEFGIAQPINVEGRWATLWHHVADEPAATAYQVATALFDLHTGLASMRGQFTFQPCWARLKLAVDLLDAPELTGELGSDDRDLLRQTLQEGIATLSSLGGPHHVLHGSPHRFNILVMDGKAVFIDFETVELGPLEWDLAHLDEEVASFYPTDLDEGLLRTCRISISAATSAWCWEGIDRGADMRSHAKQHLEIAREAHA